MTSRSASIEDLLALARRGELSEADQRRLDEALESSAEERVLYETGRAFDREAPVEPGDDARLERLMRVVERRRVPRRRSSWRVAIPAALAGALAATAVIAAVQAYRPAPERSAAREALETQPPPSSARRAVAAGAPEATPSASPLAAPLPPAAAPGVVGDGVVGVPVALPPSARGSLGGKAKSPPEPAPGLASAPSSVAAFADAPAPPTGNAGSLFAAANAARVEGDSARAISLYRQLQAQFPAAGEALASRVSLGMMLLRAGNAQGALDEFRAYRARGGGATLAEALWGEARALRQLGRIEEERQALRHLLERFPSSAYASAAQKRLTDLP